MRVLALVLLPALALAAPPAAPRRITALLVPLDADAEGSTLKLEGYMNEALGRFQSFSLRPPEELFGMPEDAEAQASLKRGARGLTESLAAFDKHDYEDAERKVRATLKELGKAAAAIKSCAELCQATALYAAVLQQRGDMEEARLILLDLLALDPTFELDTKRYSKDFIALRAQVATSRNATLRGNLTVKSHPAGARVYVDGQLKGFTPMTVQTLPIGKHLLHVVRPGFVRHGELLEISPDDLEANATLSANDARKAYEAQLDGVAKELTRNAQGTAVPKLGKLLGLDWVMLGTVRVTPDTALTEVNLAYVEVSSGKKLASRLIAVDGDEYGQLKSEMMRLVNHLVNNAEGGAEKTVRSSDPLENRHGMEDWNAEDQGGKRRNAEKKAKGGDPLDGVSGMEDW